MSPNCYYVGDRVRVMLEHGSLYAIIKSFQTSPVERVLVEGEPGGWRRVVNHDQLRRP